MKYSATRLREEVPGSNGVLMHCAEIIIHLVTTSSTSQFITYTTAARLSGCESATATPSGSDSFTSLDSPRLKLGIASCGKSCTISQEPAKCFSIASICIRNPFDSCESCQSTSILLFDLFGISLMRASITDFATTFLTLLSGLHAPRINSSNSVMASASR